MELHVILRNRKHHVRHQNSTIFGLLPIPRLARSFCGLGLCPFSGLFYDLLLRGGQGLSPECALPKEHLVSSRFTIVTCTAWRTLGTLVPYLPKWGGTISWALRSLAVTET